MYIYVLYHEIEQPQSEAQIRNDVPILFIVTKIKEVKSQTEANSWVNKNSLHRSWRRYEGRNKDTVE